MEVVRDYDLAGHMHSGLKQLVIAVQAIKCNKNFTMEGNIPVPFLCP